MITALLLPLYLLGAPAHAATPDGRSRASTDPAIQIWISDNRRFLPGDRAKVQVRTREDGYLLVLHVDTDGHLRVLFPLDPTNDNFVRGGRKYDIRGRGGRESFTADEKSGRGTVYAAVSHDPFRFDQFTLSDHWDYRNLAPQRLPADPEPDLNDLVRKMADASFDYDILTYDVVERVVYADDYSRPYYDSYYGGYDGCAYSYYSCGRSYYGSPYRLSIGLFFGRPYRPFYYDPFGYAAYDPFYNPFFYDPYYYRPAYPVGGYAFPYYNYPYSFGGYYNRYPGAIRPYTPYRFRPADGVLAGYRDRRYNLRSVNTVYMPPVVRGRESVNSNPIRRVTNERVGGDASPAIGRRSGTAVGDATARRAPDRTQERLADRDEGSRVDSRLVRPNIDARRAREPEDRKSLIPDARDARDRRDLPIEVKPTDRSDNGVRRAANRPDEGRGSASRPDPQIEARPSRPEDGASRGGGSNGAGVDRGGSSRPDPFNDEPRSAPEPRRAEPRSDPQPDFQPESRPTDRGGDRGSYSPRSGSGGGSAAGGGSGGGGGSREDGNRGGGRRR
jgi:hypothetical protein